VVLAFESSSHETPRSLRAARLARVVQPSWQRGVPRTQMYSRRNRESNGKGRKIRAGRRKARLRSETSKKEQARNGRAGKRESERERETKRDREEERERDRKMREERRGGMVPAKMGEREHWLASPW
jgi:hypothetical protein